MKTFCFITTLTPSRLLSDLRKDLFDLYLSALKSQTYPNWFVLIVGEENKVDDNFIYLRSELETKPDKLKVAYNYLHDLDKKPDYLIRLDDDDLISPYILEYAAKLNFDCLADRFHTYYDIASASISQQDRSWLPNTVIHAFEHAMKPYGDQKLPLFMHDHSQAWHNYYSDKLVHFVERNHPVYLRIISPTTITSRMDAAKAKSYVDFDNVAYQKYLITFGKWKRFNIDDFTQYINPLIEIWENFSNQKIKIKKRSFFNFFK